MRTAILILFLVATALAQEAEQARELLESPDLGDRKKGAALLAAIRSREAVELLIPLIEDEEYGEAAYRFVTRAWDPAHALELLEKGIADPDIVIGNRYLWALSDLSRGPNAIGFGFSGPGFHGPGGRMWLPPDFQKWLPAIAKALPTKRAHALPLALLMVLRGEKAEEECRQAAVRAWPLMGNEQRKAMLEFNWEKVRTPDFEPLLLELLELLELPTRPTPWHVADLTSLVVLRLGEFQPGKTREIILADLRRPEPLMAECVLLSLPDESLPDLEEAWDAMLRDTRRVDLYKIAPIVERYATSRLMDRVRELVHPGGWAGSSPAFLGYLVKHDRENGLAEVRAAALRRGKEETGCYRSVLNAVLPRYWGPDAEALALSFLYDPEEAVRRNVVSLLFASGSSKCAGALLEALGKPEIEEQVRDDIIGGFMHQKPWELTAEERKLLYSSLDTDYARAHFRELWGE